VRDDGRRIPIRKMILQTRRIENLWFSITGTNYIQHPRRRGASLVFPTCEAECALDLHSTALSLMGGPAASVVTIAGTGS